MKAPYPLLLVEWDDSCSHGDAWEKLKDIDDPQFFEPTNHLSIGWEMRRTARALTLAANLGCIGDERNECASGLFTIPLAVIRRETVLRKAGKP